MRLFFIFLFHLFLINADALFNLDHIDLFEAEEIALEHNKYYLISQKNQEAAHQRKLQAVSMWLPKVEWNSFYARTENKQVVIDYISGNILFNKNQYINKLEVHQPIFVSDIYYNLKSRYIEDKIYQEQKQTTKNDLLLNVRKGYFSVVLYEAALAIQRENIEYLTEALALEQRQYEIGNSITLEVNRSKVAVANALSTYYSTLKQLKESRNGLINTLGVPPILEKGLSVCNDKIPLFKIPELSEKLDELKEQYHYSYQDFFTTDDFLDHIDRMEQARKLTLFSEAEVNYYLHLAKMYRPELKQQNFTVQLAEEEVRTRRGNYLPEITGFAAYQYNGGEEGEKSLFREKFHFEGGIKLNWNLFDSLLRERKIDEAITMRQAQKIAYEQLLDDIEIQIRDLLYRIEDALLAYLSSTESVFLAEQTMQEAKDKLEFGKITPLAYRDTANALAQAKNQQNISSFNLIMSYYMLRFATGQDTASHELY